MGALGRVARLRELVRARVRRPASGALRLRLRVSRPLPPRPLGGMDGRAPRSFRPAGSGDRVWPLTAGASGPKAYVLSCCRPPPRRGRTPWPARRAEPLRAPAPLLRRRGAALPAWPFAGAPPNAPARQRHRTTGAATCGGTRRGGADRPAAVRRSAGDPCRGCRRGRPSWRRSDGVSANASPPRRDITVRPCLAATPPARRPRSSRPARGLLDAGARIRCRCTGAAAPLRSQPRPPTARARCPGEGRRPTLRCRAGPATGEPAPDVPVPRATSSAHVCSAAGQPPVYALRQVRRRIRRSRSSETPPPSSGAPAAAPRQAPDRGSVARGRAARRRRVTGRVEWARRVPRGGSAAAGAHPSRRR